MNSNQSAQEPRALPLPVALLPILALVLIMGSAVLLFGADPHVPLLMSTVVSVIIGLIYGHKWKDIQSRIIESVSSVSETVLILMLIGGLVAMWIVSGTVPAMVYYGLKVINPSFFLVTSCALCCIVSVACGSSWTTAATVGIALMGIGAGLGINPAMTAGSVVSGSFFGDRLSPLSDITNLTSAVTKVNLFEHIRHMIYTSAPALILAMIIYFFLGLQYSSDSMDMSTIHSMQQTLAANFDLNPILLLPPVLVVLMVVFRVPAIPGLAGGIALGGVFFIFFQGGLQMGFSASFQTIIECINYGAVVETGDAFIDGLLTRLFARSLRQTFESGQRNRLPGSGHYSVLHPHQCANGRRLSVPDDPWPHVLQRVQKAGPAGKESIPSSGGRRCGQFLLLPLERLRLLYEQHAGRELCCLCTLCFCQPDHPHRFHFVCLCRHYHHKNDQRRMGTG